MHLDQELQTDSRLGSEPVRAGPVASGLRDSLGRTLDQAQQEDQMWREAEVRQAERTLVRVRRLEGRVGLSAAALGIGLIALGVLCSRFLYLGPLEANWLVTVTGMFLGSAGVCLSAALLLVLGKKYRVGIRRQLRDYGVSAGEPPKARALTVRKRSYR